jgi:hypothetical protein
MRKLRILRKRSLVTPAWERGFFVRFGDHIITCRKLFQFSKKGVSQNRYPKSVKISSRSSRDHIYGIYQTCKLILLPQPKQPDRILCGGLSKLFQAHPANFRRCFGNQLHIGALIALSAVRMRSEIRSICFNQ